MNIIEFAFASDPPVGVVNFFILIFVTVNDCWHGDTNDGVTSIGVKLMT